MRRTFRRHFRKEEPPKFRVNQFITAPEVVVIDGEGNNLGTIATPVAIQKARDAGLDLVEVSPKATPPVTKLLNYGSFKYQQEKLERQQKARSKKVEIKGVRLSLGIGQHDRQVRLEQAREFIDDGDRVQIELVLRGRERQHTDLARTIIQTFITELGEDVAVDQPLSSVGGRLTTMVKKK